MNTGPVALFILCCITGLVEASKYRVVCYFVSWSRYEGRGSFKFFPKDVDPSLCTHVALGFMDLKPDGSLATRDWSDQASFETLRELPGPDKPAILASIGFTPEYLSTFLNITASPSKRQNLVNSISSFVQTHQLSGVDLFLNFEEPGQALDKENIRSFFEELNTKADDAGFIVSTSLSASVDVAASYYDVSAISRLVEFINILTYDFPQEADRTSFNAPLKGPQGHTANVAAATEWYLSQNIEPEKLVLGFATYGKVSTLVNSAATTPGSSANNSAAWISKNPPVIAGYETCEVLRSRFARTELDATYGSYYTVVDDQWLTYDNIQSVTNKCAYVEEKRLGGVMVWTLDYDVFKLTPSCPQVVESYPLLRAANRRLGRLPTPQLPSPALPPAGDGRRTQIPDTGKKVIMCYYTNWAQYAPVDEYKFTVDKTDPSLCTHIILAFANLLPNFKAVTFEWNDEAVFSKLAEYRSRHPGLQILVSIGGWKIGSGVFSPMAASAYKRDVFVTSVAAMVERYQLNGVDIDWEFPTINDGVPEDKEGFTLLMKDLRDRAEVDGFLLTAAVSAGLHLTPNAYEPRELTKHIHYLNLQTYDFHYYPGVVGFLAPLDGPPQSHNVKKAVQWWIGQGMPSKQIILGVPLYGHAFTLNGTNHTIGAPKEGNGHGGPYRKLEEGTLAQFEICEMMKNPLAKVFFDEVYQAPYLVLGDQWVTYDDETSIKAKMQLVLDMNLGGAMAWSLDFDDFRPNPNCDSKEKFPLMSAIRRELFGGKPIYAEIQEDLSGDTYDCATCSGFQTGSTGNCLTRPREIVDKYNSYTSGCRRCGTFSQRYTLGGALYSFERGCAERYFSQTSPDECILQGPYRICLTTCCGDNCNMDDGTNPTIGSPRCETASRGGRTATPIGRLNISTILIIFLFAYLL